MYYEKLVVWYCGMYDGQPVCFDKTGFIVDLKKGSG